MVLTDKMLSDIGLLSDQVIELTSQLSSSVQEELSKQPRLQKINVTYPRVGWSIKTRLEQLDDETYLVSAELELDLERNLRIPIRFGESRGGNVLKSLEEEKIPTTIPDKDRQAFGLKVEAEFVKPDGTVGKVDLNELKGEKRAARTVDVGSGAPNREVRMLSDNREGASRVEMTGGQQGEEIKLPSQLPEVTLDIPDIDLLGEPPTPQKEPPKVPLPPKGSMAQTTKPGVKFKR
jgi:hypothetical protein